MLKQFSQANYRRDIPPVAKLNNISAAINLYYGDYHVSNYCHVTDRIYFRYLKAKNSDHFYSFAETFKQECFLAQAILLYQ